MNTHRQRIQNAFKFNYPDKIPVVYHPSTAGLYKHGKKPLDIFIEYPPDNPVDFNSIPAPLREALIRRGNIMKLSGINGEQVGNT